MWKWFRGMRSDRRDGPIADSSFIERRIGMSSGKYLALYRYLENRYADVTVLTFEQIEALLGFALPPLARTQLDWWATRSANGDAAHSAAWTLAGRTATPNLSARTVLFERVPVARQGRR